MKLRITTDIVIEDGVTKITNTTVVPISDEVSEPVAQGKQETLQEQPQVAHRVPIPAPVGQTPTQGKGDWFAGTTWGNS